MIRARILIVDDHELFRGGLRSFLESRADLEVCGEASSGLQAIARAHELRPDVILMDVSLPGMGGLEATRLICQEMPAAKIIILSQHDLSHIVSAAAEAGAKAYVVKSHAAKQLFSALDTVMENRTFDWNYAVSRFDKPAAQE